MGSVAGLHAELDALLAADAAGLSDEALRSQVRQLLAASNRLFALLADRVAHFDARALSHTDGFRSTPAWLRAFGRLSGHAAASLVRAGRVLRRLPGLAAAAAAGAASPEHVTRVSLLAGQIGEDNVLPADQTLAHAAAQLGPADLGRLCDRVRDHIDPDGAAPDAKARFDRRALTLSPLNGMLVLRGQLDPEGGAALTEALDALMRPPAPHDPRTPAQRRADALVDLARGALAHGDLPTTGGHRPQVGILLTPQTLHTGPPSSQPTDPPDPRPPTGTGPPDPPPTGTGESGPDGQPPTTAPTPPGEPAWLNWHGPIPPALAQRIACDADLYAAILNPANGLPLYLGRTHRLVPPSLRKALHARDRGCRWPGCTAPTPWTDAHHLHGWHPTGVTDVDNLVLLCRYHHVLVHEGGWHIRYDPNTGQIHITTPDGRPYELGPTHPWTSPTTRPDDTS